MAVTFLDPGGDAGFDAFMWYGAGGSPSAVSDFVHGGHLRSLAFRPANFDVLETETGIFTGRNGIFSLYIYIVAYPSSNCNFAASWGATIFAGFGLTSSGNLIVRSNNGTVLGTGSIIPLNTWTRVSAAFNLTSTSVNEFRVFINGSLDISITNTTLNSVGDIDRFRIGNTNTNSTLNIRISDVCTDNSSSLADTGDIWVTAKRPNANGTINGFTTQIGSGGSGYGSGHSPQVNERPTDTANGWSMVGAGSAVTEEYNVESKSTGDIDISTATIVDWLGWVNVKALAGTPTIQIILDGTNNAQVISTSVIVYRKVKGSSTYPSGTGADIGIVTDTSLTTESLYECGIVVAYIPGASTFTNSGMLAVL